MKSADKRFGWTLPVQYPKTGVSRVKTNIELTINSEYFTSRFFKLRIFINLKNIKRKTMSKRKAIATVKKRFVTMINDSELNI